mgnify:FL=1
MKIAVCLSGMVRGQVPRNLQRLKRILPYDYFFSTYTHKEEDLWWFLGMNGEYTLFDEPEMHYNPVMDPPELYTRKLRLLKQDGERGESLGVIEKTKHHTKQILSHANLVSHIPEDYDMIIRVRYDAFISQKIDFVHYLERSLNENIAIGFGTRTSRWIDLDKLYVVPRRWPNGVDDTISQDWGSYLMDVMIMHPRKLLDTKHAFKLHEEKKLLPAEVGWWQLLSEPTGGENHISMYGGAQIERFLTRTRYDNQHPRIPT